MAAASKNFIKIVKRDDRVHIIPDTKHNREFHNRYTNRAPQEDKYKAIQLVTGHYLIDDETGGSEFIEGDVLEDLYKNHSPIDGKLEAAESEIDSLKAQIEALKKKKNGKGKEEEIKDPPETKDPE